MIARIDDDERRARLAQRHRLLPRLRTDDVVQIADDLVALHSTDPVTVVLSALVRMVHPSVAAVEDVVYEQRALIRHHAMRRTLWLATPDTVRLMHAAATRKLVPPARRQVLKMLTAAGVAEPEAWLDDAGDQVVAHLREHGPSTARDIGRQVSGLRVPLQLAPGKPYASTQGAHSQVITLLGFQGTNHECAVCDRLRYSRVLLGILEDSRRIHSGFGLGVSDLVRVHDTQPKEPEVTHGPSRCAYIQRIAGSD